MSRRRSNNSWGTAIRDARKVQSESPKIALAKFLARRAAEDDYESLLQRQRMKKLKETRQPTQH